MRGAWEPTENLGVVTTDPLHLNSVQRVGRDVASAYDWLNPEDLLVSFRSLFGRRGDAVQRPHQDGIRITTQSPEAFEEPIWQLFIPHAHQSNASLRPNR